MDSQKFNLLLNKLLERTEEGKLTWKTTANRETFLAVLKGSSISISQDQEFLLNIDGEPHESYLFYTFDFRNENGEIIASVDVSEKDEFEENFKKAEKIFNLARNQSFKIDQTFDRILEQLAA